MDELAGSQLESNKKAMTIHVISSVYAFLINRLSGCNWSALNYEEAIAGLDID